MKKLFIYPLLFIFTLPVFTGFSQSTDVSTDFLDYNLLEKRMEKSNSNIQDEKKGSRSSTWYKRGLLFQDIADVDIEMLQIGMEPSYVQILIGSPKEKVQKEDGVEVHKYERINLHYKGGVLNVWEKTKTLHEKPLHEAMSSFKKAIELDEKGKMKSKLDDELERLKKQFYSVGFNYFNMQQYDEAFNHFQKAVETIEMVAYEGNKVDTLLYFHTGLAANLAENLEGAAKYYQKALDAGYLGEGTSKGEIIFYLTDAYFSLNDTANAIETLKTGMKKMPDNKNIMLTLIDTYIKTDQSKQALEYIDIAKEKDPTNATLYFAEGALFEELGEKDKAINSYKKALEFDPDNANVNYNLGVMYYNQGVIIFNEAADIKD
ncbi:MAG: tetratricopeptide repeat protein, partial [bacterium]